AFVRRHPQALAPVLKSGYEPGAPVISGGDAEGRQTQRILTVRSRNSAARCAAAATPRLPTTEAAACPRGNAGAPGGSDALADSLALPELLPEEQCGDPEADDDDRRPRLLPSDQTREAGAGVASQDRSHDHDQGRGPVDGAPNDEIGGGHAVDAHP